MEHIYILKLGDGKYYIGKTKNVEKRWAEHITGNGSGWTKRYKPMSLIKTVVSTSYFDEDKYVKEYMSKYGIENVRGGTYSNIDLDTNCISVLEKEIRHSKNLWTRCGRNTHFIKDCYAKTDSNLDQSLKHQITRALLLLKPLSKYQIISVIRLLSFQIFAIMEDGVKLILLKMGLGQSMYLDNNGFNITTKIG